jgi:dienelactone hydrolase
MIPSEIPPTDPASTLGVSNQMMGRTAALVILALFVSAIGAVAAEPVAGAGPGWAPPKDQRIAPLKDLDGYFPFAPPETAGQWEIRAERVRRQIAVSQGLWPMPSRTALNPVIHGRIDRGDHTVEKVYFESVPGFYVTGNLYRPKGKSGKLPAVLSAHGHWEDGRFHDKGQQRVRREIVEGGERFEEGGRSPLQARCVQLARMGCVVFHFDMIGYADSEQISMAIAHSFAKQRPEMNVVAGWGLYSPQAEARLQSVMGLQTWNSIRALDFLLALPDVDERRVAVTGASGGGTQTFLLCALDSRPAVSFPAVMVSTAMQGGCTCENASLLRIGTGNVEFAALFAPKPLGLTAADDWTREMAAKGFPELQKLYSMLGAPKNVMLKPLLHFGHNYNYVSRAAMYSWLNQHLKLGLQEPIVEEDYVRLSKGEMSVWNDEHPKPASGPSFERKLLRWLHEDSERQLDQAGKSLETFRNFAGKAIDVVIGRSLEEAGQVEWRPTTRRTRGGYSEASGYIQNTTHGEELPAVLLEPPQRSGRTVLWLTESGKAGLYDNSSQLSDPEPRSEIKKLLASGAAVLSIDLLYQGDFHAGGKPLTRTRRVQNPRESAAYSFGYNPALFAQRVHDVLSAVAFVRSSQKEISQVDLVCLDSAGPIAAAALAQSRGAINRAAINTGGFRFADVRDIHDINFLPGGAKYGDLPGFLALAAPVALWLSGEGVEAPSLVGNIYRSANAAEKLTLPGEQGPELASAAVAWLLAQ